VCRVLYSIALTVRSHIAISFVTVIVDIASFKQGDAYYVSMFYKIPLFGYRVLAKCLVLLRCESAILFFVF